MSEKIKKSQEIKNIKIEKEDSIDKHIENEKQKALAGLEVVKAELEDIGGEEELIKSLDSASPEQKNILKKLLENAAEAVAGLVLIGGPIAAGIAMYLEVMGDYSDPKFIDYATAGTIGFTTTFAAAFISGLIIYTSSISDGDRYGL